MKPLAEDLRRWKLASGGGDDDLMFPGRDRARGPAGAEAEVRKARRSRKFA